ncbi:MAG TPA: LysM peptidoglycan-binding domain-containing protein [Anaeromyxobacteraceae bacterium]|jgi:hypothetical protein
MRAVSLAALIALAPSAAAAQSQAVESAKQAREQVRESTERRQQAADAQVEQGAERPAPGTLDLGPGAGRLEGRPPGAAEGTGAPPPSPGAVPPPDTYTVRPGDTLWDLSGRFLNNPWYWPKVWSYNPELTNPHWIYPGNLLRFFPATEEAPARVEVAVPTEAPPVEELAPPRELEDLSRAEGPPDYGDEDAVAVVGPYKVGYVAAKGVLMRRDTFVTQRELEEAGVISGAFEDKLMLSITDRAYARFRDPQAPQVGQTYLVFRTVRPVVRPGSGERIGYQTAILGAGRAVAKDERTVTLTITEASDAIERGDYVGPATERLLKMVVRRPNLRQLDGVVVSAGRPGTWLAAEHQLVFVDRGRADGVEEGNVFTVTRAGDPYGEPLREDMSMREDTSFPSEDIGELLVIDAKEHFSTTLVVRSLRELLAGDRVEMRVAAAARN